jgi:hypothetical protein
MQMPSKLYWLRGDLACTSKRIPLPWATVMVVILCLPLTFYLGEWNFPLWVSFIVWAQYFALGASATTWKIIIPSLPFGGTFAAAWCTSAVAFSDFFIAHFGPVHGLYAAYAISSVVWAALLVYGLSWSNAFTAGTLAVFNGFTLQFATYFTHSVPKVGPIENPYYLIWWSFLWSVLMGYFGWFLGWLNVVLTLPRKQPSN